MSSLLGPVVRTRVRFEGTVQGVGFRPHVYRVARDLGLTGWVLNDEHGVLAEVEGDPRVVERFAQGVVAGAPPLALIERVTVAPCPALGGEATGFEIRASPAATGHADAPVTPDTGICADCLRELLDPADRRHRYPFINCTNCGPRFTIVRGVPYDRPLTTMASFTMCERCQAEYDDPGDRRFHAQPNACPVCGPALSLVRCARDDRVPAVGEDPLRAAAAALREGAIVAIKGIGGYHLACRADEEQAVARLRARKHREDKPFALMVADVSAAQELVMVDEAVADLLASPARPIVLAPRRPDAPVAPSVAPGAPELGVMLPYSPLHHLLIHDVAAGPLVLTSGNVSDEPIAFRDEDARDRLGPIADLILTHDRPIETRTDDSVRRVVSVGERALPVFLRRSRGHVPASLSPGGPGGRGTPVPLLACGAELKNTFCLARGERAWVSHHVGDLENYETLRSFTDGIAHFERLFDVRPQVVVHDLHPEYLSTKYALERGGVELIAVQHHHAHLAACLAEHGRQRAVGAILDGTGFGLDGTVWGGEILVGDCASFRRVASLPPVPMPGATRAVREPWRMACAWLDAAFGEVDAEPLAGIDAALWEPVLRMARSGLNSPITTSAGRLCDAVAALCGVRASTVTYEGQAAIELEALCDPSETGRYEFDGLDPRPAIRAIVSDLRAGVPVPTVATRFHAGFAAAIVDACLVAAGDHQVSDVVLSGGVFHNRRLLEGAAAGLHAAGLRVLTPSVLPAGDGGISFGQAAVATALLNEGAS